MVVAHSVVLLVLPMWDRLKYVEQEMAKKRGRDLGTPEVDAKPAEDDLYVIPEHLKVDQVLLREEYFQ